MIVRVYGYRGTSAVLGGSGSGGVTGLSGDVTAGPGTGVLAALVVGLDNVPFCSGFTPTNGQSIQYSTGLSPNPCYTAAAGGAVPSGSAGGDLSGSYPNPGVAQVNGAAVPTSQAYVGTNGGGQIIAAATPGGGGALVLIEQHTASSSASLNFTTCISSTYDNYQIALINVLPATDGRNIYWRASTDGGSSYDAGANYSLQSLTLSTGSIASNSSGLSQISIAGAVSNNASYGVTATFRLYSPGSPSLFKAVEGLGVHYNGSARVGDLFTGAYEVATAVNAFQVIASTGNIASGTVRCYGIAK